MPSHRTICEKAKTRWDAASKAFCDWAIANGFGHVKFGDLEKAIAGNAQGEKLFAADRVARQALDEAESAAVITGHAWRGTFGMVSFYSTSEIRRFAAQKRRAR